MTLRPDTEEPSFGAGLFGAAVFGFFGGMTVLLAPWLLAWQFPIRIGLFTGISGLTFSPTFQIWSLIVALMSLHTGFQLGISKALDVLNLIWGTGECLDKDLQALADRLRSRILISAIATYALICLH